MGPGEQPDEEPVRRPEASGIYTSRMTLLRQLFILCALIAAAVAPATGQAERGAGDRLAGGSAPSAVAASRQADNLAVIPITGPIDRFVAVSVERRLEIAEESGADAVVIELDTPGGEVGAVLEICNMIKSSALPVSAWVNVDAYSGGAIIALACEEIYVAEYATMGDAAPVAMNPIKFAQGLERTERQKILQPLITEVVDSARRRGYDERLVQAFLTLGIELWMIEEKDADSGEGGRRVFVTESQYRELFGEDPPRENVQAASGNPSGGSAGTEAAAGDPIGPEAREAVERSQELPPAIPDLSGEDPADWRLVEYAVDGESLLTLKTEDLRRFGLASEVVADEGELRALYGASNVTTVGMTWSERLAIAMTSMWVRGLLVAVFLIGLFVEFLAPGIGLAGGVALAALGLLIVPPAIAGAAAWWALAAILGGIGLVVVELFVFPGFGIFGIAGLITVFVGLVGAVVGPGPLFPDSPARESDLLHGVATVLVSVMAAGIAMYFISRYHGAMPVLNKLVLATRSGDEVYTENGLPAHSGVRNAKPGAAVGAVGVSTTPLRPSGTAEFDGELVDVVSELGMIGVGERVRVIKTTRFRTVVAPADDPAFAPEGESDTDGGTTA